METQQLQFKCWKLDCQQVYEMAKEIDDQTVLRTICPFCGTEGIVDLDPFRQTPDRVMRHVDKQTKAFPHELSLPDMLSTHKPSGRETDEERS